MRHLLIFAVLSFALANLQYHPPDPEGKMDFIQMATFHGYPTQEHFVETKDGYILRVFRIQAGEIKARSKVVFWQHGLMDSAAGGLCNDEARAPLYILANQGYDVWVGNSRGNLYSRNHTSLDVSKRPFWQFTFGDMAKNDIPAVLSYVRAQTGRKIHYIGHSQGTTQMFAALADHIPNVEEHLLAFHALAPVTHLLTQTDLQTIANIKVLPLLLRALGINEIGSTFLNEQVGRVLCAYLDGQCVKLITLLMNLDSTLDNPDRSDVLLAHFMAGTSVKNLLHWRKLVLTQDFVRYDGTKYPLDSITARVNLYIGSADKLGDLVGTEMYIIYLSRTKSRLTKAKLWSKEYKLGHSTFLIAKDMSYFNDVIANIENISE